jgi:hypothetical protein
VDETVTGFESTNKIKHFQNLYLFQFYDISPLVVTEDARYVNFKEFSSYVRSFVIALFAGLRFICQFRVSILKMSYSLGPLLTKSFMLLSSVCGCRNNCHAECPFSQSAFIAASYAVT